MSVELPPLPEPFDNVRYFSGKEECRFDLFTDDQLRAYALEALQDRKPLTDEQIAEACGWKPGIGCKPLPQELRIARAIERAHGIGEQA